MFDLLSEKLQETFKKLRGQGRITEKNIREVMREVRLALLEADVNYKVARDFIRRVEEKAIGQEVLRSLTPDMQVLKIVRDELIALMGAEAEKLRVPPSGRLTAMLVGLNGAGKTTASAKLALRLKKEGRSPLLVALDVYRPAAIKQLQVLGEQAGVPVFTMGTETPPPQTALASLRYAERNGHNAILWDTAGRLQTNEELMEELEAIQQAVLPNEILLVADATTGQEAVNVAAEFHRRLTLTGVILSKMDGDARGGAAISIRAVTGVPIKFFSTGEKLDALEPFHPDRIASRILGRGDIQTLIEKAEEVLDEQKAREIERKIREQEGLTFEDFLDQLRQIQRMGSLDQLLGMIPGMDRLRRTAGLEVDEKQIKRVEAIILSMTPEERRNPRLLDASRKRRIARGSGTSVPQVNQLCQQLAQMNRAMKQLAKLSSGGGRGKRKRKRNAAADIFRFPV
ncbi:MAG: signal recognition particle protein [Candidatus Poribacteria bacterium]|nr:MAG: signal recognition particle protein [Candidatus Poribacteria bacterium]